MLQSFNDHDARVARIARALISLSNNRFRCESWMGHDPIRCEMHIGHLGMHRTHDNTQFGYVPRYKDILAVSWPNVQMEQRFGEMHDSTVLAGMRKELGA